MSANQQIGAVQGQVTVPSLSDLNPLQSNVPLVQTLAHGDVPSNAVINDAFDRAKGGLDSAVPESDLNLHGKTLANDASQILDAAQRFLNEKNKDEKLQDLIKHSKQAADATGREASSLTSSLSSLFSSTFGLRSLVNKDSYTAQRDMETAYGYVQELFLFTIQSKEFRSILLDMINFFQSSLTSATDKVNQIGDSLKVDINQKDSNMTAASSTANATAQDTKLQARSQISQWNAQTKREYYQRFQSLLNRLSSKPEYKRLLGLYWKWMDDLKKRASQIAETLKDKAAVAADHASTSGSRLADKSAWDKLWYDVRGIVDGFAGAGSFDLIYAQSWDLYLAVTNDKDTNQWLESLKVFINDAIDTPSALNSDAKMKEGEDLLERGKDLFEKEKFSRKINGLFDSGRTMLDHITTDSISNELSDDFKKFMEDFALDSQGRPDLNVMADSLHQIKNLAFPLVSKQLSALSVARLVGSNETIDWAVENLLVSVPNLIPEHFILKTKNLLSINVKEMEAEKNNTKVVMEVSNIRPTFNDLKFWYQRKTFPRIEDYGTIDVDFSKGAGAKIKIIWKIKSKQNRPFAFSLMEVRCVIDSLEVNIKEAKHSIFDRVATSFFSASMKQQLAAAIVNGLVDALSPINDQMNQYFTTRPTTSIMDKANKSIQYYYDATNQAIKERPIEKVMDKATELKDRAVDAISQATDNASAVLSNAKTSAENTLTAAKEIVQERAAEVKDYVNKEVPELSKAVGNMKVDAENMAARVQQGAVSAEKEAFGWYNEKASDVVVAVERTAAKVENVVAVEQGKVENAWDHAWEKKEGRRHKRKSHKKSKHSLPLEDLKEFPDLK